MREFQGIMQRKMIFSKKNEFFFLSPVDFRFFLSFFLPYASFLRLFFVFCLRIYPLYMKICAKSIDKPSKMLYNIKNTC